MNLEKKVKKSIIKKNKNPSELDVRNSDEKSNSSGSEESSDSAPDIQKGINKFEKNNNKDKKHTTIIKAEEGLLGIQPDITAPTIEIYDLPVINTDVDKPNINKNNQTFKENKEFLSDSKKEIEENTKSVEASFITNEILGDIIESKAFSSYVTEPQLNTININEQGNQSSQLYKSNTQTGNYKTTLKEDTISNTPINNNVILDKQLDKNNKTADKIEIIISNQSDKLNDDKLTKDDKNLTSTSKTTTVEINQKDIKDIEKDKKKISSWGSYLPIFMISLSGFLAFCFLYKRFKR